jgi:hypothetical protein
MSHQSVEDALQAAESPVEMLRNSQIGPYAFPGTAEFHPTHTVPSPRRESLRGICRL